MRSLTWLQAPVLPVWLCLHPGCMLTAPPELECVDTMSVGDEVTLRATNVDDSLLWSWHSDGGAAGVFLVDGEALDEHLGTGLVDEQGRSTGVVEVVFRAVAQGSLTIVGEEQVIGPGIGLPRPLTTVSCQIIIVRPAQDNP